ncbi:MAG: hypothetical protein EOP51_10480 [Sphingobacteriales bacterium]|nr:MAG: hypothetical protein EOP51_10480 [Sphingobacteriales bacterium]
MFSNLVFYLFSHSLLRWLLFIALVASLIRAWTSYRKKRPFSYIDNSIRHWTATLAHMQLVFGIILYSQSPIVKYFWQHKKEGFVDVPTTFFGLVHMLLMLMAIVLITIGSSLAKRKPTDADKHRTVLLWYTIALCVIFVAIPWPFSPLAQRPYIRQF